MAVAIRIIIILIVISTLLLNLRWRQRFIVIGASLILGLVASIIVISVSDEPEIRSGPRTVPTIDLAPTRAPEGPSFVTACRSFQLLVRDIENNRLDDYELRLERETEVRNNARFPGSPQSFMGLINAYIEAVDRKLGGGPESDMSELGEVDIANLERVITRARNDMFSECRARGS